MKDLPPYKPELYSDELWDKLIQPLNDAPGKYSFQYKTRIIHLYDAVLRGTVSKMEAYDAVKADYFPAVLELRASSYQHLIY